MADYVVPQTRVFQDFLITPAVAANPLRAHITGPHAQLVRYANVDERPGGLLGYYDPLLAASYLWPARPAGGIADPTYTKLWMANALLRYFTDSISGGSNITKVSGSNNRIRSDTVNFATHGAAVRNPTFFDRDVKVGDIAKVRAVTGVGASVTLWTYVKALTGDLTTATVSPAAADANNAAAQAQTSAVTKVAGPDNCVTVAVTAGSYDGLSAGAITETYDVIVTGSSVNGDHTTASLRVLSGSGGDDVLVVTPAAAGSPTAIGTRGLRLTFAVTASAACSASAAADAVGPDDLIVGQRWHVMLHQTFVVPAATSSGNYTGLTDTTYVVEVSRGGNVAATIQPQIKVTTTNGVDISGPTTVTAAATPVQIGSKTVLVAFSSLLLRKGDRYYVDVFAGVEGPRRTLDLGHNLDTAIPAGSQVELTLFILKPLLQIDKNRVGFAPLTNWATSATEITVSDGIVAYDATWTDGGIARPLDVVAEASKGYGRLYAEARYWLQTLCHRVGSVGDVGALDAAISGPLDPDNPLKYGVFKALENANGSEVRFTSVCNPDSDAAWADVLGILLGRDDIYSLVPLTRRRTVLDLFAAHVKAQSGPEQGLWRVVWINEEGVPEIPVLAAGSMVPGHVLPTTLDGRVALAVVEDDPDTSGSQFTRVRFLGRNVELLAAGVRAGDTVRMLYTSDGFGTEEYSEYVIDAVQSESQVRLLTGPVAPISVGAKTEIWRNLSTTEEAVAIAVNAGSWGDRRVRATWPDKIEVAGTVVDGYFLNCSLAGLSSGVLPHQGLTHLQIVGYTDVSRTVAKFSRSQLDAMAHSGVWIVTQDLTGLDTQIGEIFTRHALTTGLYDDINQREEMVTRNVDSISYRFRDYYKPFIGLVNVTPTVKARLALETGNLIRVLQSEAQTTDLGGQLIEGTLVDIHAHAVFKDRYVIVLNLTLPYPVNNVDVHLTI